MLSDLADASTGDWQLATIAAWQLAAANWALDSLHQKR